MYKCNVQPISYGTDYNALPTFINSINPNKDKLKLRLEAVQKEIQEAFERYYINMLGSSKVVKPINVDIVRTGKCITGEHVTRLGQPITDDEIKKAMFSISNGKAPWPDGYSSKFFKDSWHIVGKEICDAIRNVFSSGKFWKIAERV